jgi:3-oxoacyl-[acyl-carrier protein] reductase
VLVTNAGIAITTGEERSLTAGKLDAWVAEMRSGAADSDTLGRDPEPERRGVALDDRGVHLNGTFPCTREALKVMCRENRGSIINLSSVAALSGADTLPHYSAAKGGILAFTRAVAREVASRNIRVNAICPGFIDTPMTQPHPRSSAGSWR